MKKIIITAVLTLWATFVSAADSKVYTQGEFDMLAQKGKPVLVVIAASWCPTCKAQKPIIGDLAKQDNYKDLTILLVDFDKNKDVLKRFKVSMQSTLIAFSAGKEMGRSIGDTSREGIENIFKKAIN